MAKVVSFNLDAALVEGVLSKGTRRVTCLEVQDAAPILASARPPHLVVLSGDAGCAADFAEGLVDDPTAGGIPFVAWRTVGSLADTSRLLALGVQVVDGDEDALRGACDGALDAQDNRTIRVDEQPLAASTAGDALEMHGRRVIVADDDPAITWFFADLLRAQGCDVDEASDGADALDRARRTMPDLVVSDIRMPRLDGLRLCRALRSDPLLADVPVLLLSWKEDWLLEAERDGVEASAYLAKRSTPEEVLARVLEVLAPHARFERRLRAHGAVRGELDGASPYRLLRVTCATHADARLTLRCETRSYEVQVRGGTPRSAMCVPVEGAVARASAALGLLLSERAGRFTLTPDTSEVDDDLLGSLHQQVAPHVARARRGILALAPVQAPTLVVPAPVAQPAPAPVQMVLQMPEYLQAMPQHPAPAPLHLVDPAGGRTTPMVLQRAPTPQAVAEHRPLRVVSEPPSTSALAVARRRSWNIPLRWLGVAAVAALGIVLGAGARVLRHAPDAGAQVQAQAR